MYSVFVLFQQYFIQSTPFSEYITNKNDKFDFSSQSNAISLNAIDRNLQLPFWLCATQWTVIIKNRHVIYKNRDSHSIFK